MIKGGISTPIGNGTGGPLYAVPANVGPRTMDYPALFTAGTYSTTMPGVKVFAGTVDDPFWIDLGGAFDTLNTSKAPPILSAAEDAAFLNLAADSLSGYAVNTIAIEVPVTMLTRTGAVEPATSTAATIGVWATTSRTAPYGRAFASARAEFGYVVSGSAHGQSAHQRAADRHWIQGPLQHGPAQERLAVRLVLSGPIAD